MFALLAVTGTATDAVCQGGVNASGGAVETFACTPPLVGRYVSFHRGRGFTLCEATVWGHEGTGPWVGSVTFSRGTQGPYRPGSCEIGCTEAKQTPVMLSSA